MELHISRNARHRYRFDEALFTLTGNVVFTNFHAARVFARRMNERRDLVRFPEQAVQAGQINAMGLIHEILHYVVSLYRRQVNPDAMAQALDWLYRDVGKDAVEQALRRFADEFPPLALYRGDVTLDAYLEGETEGMPNRQVLLEEMLMLWLANANPAFAPFQELFDDSDLARNTAYRQVVAGLHAFFDTQPPFGPDDENLVDMLRSPARAVPHSLPGQLEYIRERWGYLLGPYVYRLLRGLDLLQEEERAVFAGPGPARVVEFRDLQLEPEHFSPDRDWMPRLVLMAKNTCVWLDQLSKKYGRPITRLDQVPDEELDTLARWGFTGLWLIGLWERSRASQRIKQLCGNPDAVASAYSLFDYQIAADLGGEEAFQNLKARAWQRGIRLASDMVPNHMGIDSKWVIEHPEWFITLDHSPFPAYTFTGPDLSWHPRVGIYLEDHYYDRTDAAVVFKRVDRDTGRELYIYHGNDGTSMPWNDTAQLNYLNPKVREAVIQAILAVARRVPIIRFDAAMTLTRKHYQRLWFPEPGTGGAIPSRAEHGMTREEFDRHMPVEFWREVVERVAAEAPDTLLLAEAFWLMEGYFVRTLGMHRVYNSAFMNMLRDEENANYRQVMKNTLEFDPEILRRFVNFMNNPDERTAVDQFGKGDKYFGICTMMVTLPGLPMFGHGQVEGFAEKYGMEFRRAYWDEQPDPHLVARHEREIFPLMRRRHLFAGVQDFLLYDFVTPEGWVNEDVFAYSNRAGEERALVVYHNRFAAARGWIRDSVAFAVKGPGGEKRLVRKTLGEGLGLHNSPEFFVIFRDHLTGLEYIRNCREIHEQGLYVELGAYRCHVFLDFREVVEDEWGHYGQLAAYLNGRGVPSVEEALQQILLQPVHDRLRGLLNRERICDLMLQQVTRPGEEMDPRVLTEVRTILEDLVRAIGQSRGLDLRSEDVEQGLREMVEALRACAALQAWAREMGEVDEEDVRAAGAYLLEGLDDDPAVWQTLLGWAVVHRLGRIAGEADVPQRSRSWIDELGVRDVVMGGLREMGLPEEDARRRMLLVKVLTTHQQWCGSRDAEPVTPQRALRGWLDDPEVQRFVGVHRYQDIPWFHKESFEELVWWMFTVAAVRALAAPDRDRAMQQVAGCYRVIRVLLRAEEASGYRVERLLDAVGES